MTPAIHRNMPSKPARMLYDMGLLQQPALDYGCGYGKDAEAFGLERYDPERCPAKPAGPFKTVFCTYVLNTLPLQIDCELVIKDIQSLLTEDGLAYLTVRRDLSKLTGRTIYGYQHVVILDLPIILTRPTRFTTYELNKRCRFEVLMFAPFTKGKFREARTVA